MEVKTKQLNPARILAALGLLALGALVTVSVVMAIVIGTAKPLGDHVEVEGASFTVEFISRTTTAEEYDALRTVCEGYRESSPKLATTSNDAVVVSEETFVDAGPPEGEYQPDAPVYVESDAVYFEDLVLIRYVSQSGEHLTLAGGYDENGEAAALTMEELSDLQFRREGTWYSDLLPEEERTDEGAVTEAAYLACVEQCVRKLLVGDMDYDALYSHFTEAGRNALLRVGQSGGFDGTAVTETLVCAAGASAPEESVADRLYLRCQVQMGERTAVLDLLLKLNSELMIFDVDLI